MDDMRQCGMINRDERLNNWARWVRVTFRYGHCMSLEGKYKAPRNDDDKNVLSEIDALDAAKIEKVICHPSFPEKMRELLKADYVLRADYRKTCRELGIRFSEYDIEVQRAELMVWNRMKEKT